MKIKMLTTNCCSDVKKNWSKGQILDVEPEEAKARVDAMHAINLDPFPTAKSASSKAKDDAESKK
jgi:hypothetical protein